MSAENKSYTDRTWNEIVLVTRDDAERVLDRMRAILDESGHVTVSDLYDLVDIVGTYVDVRKGWTDLLSAEIKRVSEGYSLVFPEPEPVDYGRSTPACKGEPMNAGNKKYTDRTWIYEVDPASHSGETDRVEMKDITSEFVVPSEADQFLNFMLANACGVKCVDPENEGYDLFDLESNEYTYRFIARLDRVDVIKEKFYYDIKAVYVA